MSDYVQVQVDSTGKKVETAPVYNETEQVHRQVVTLGGAKESEIRDLLKEVVFELKESRRVLCEIARVEYNEL